MVRLGCEGGVGWLGWVGVSVGMCRGGRMGGGILGGGDTVAGSLIE